MRVSDAAFLTAQTGVPVVLVGDYGLGKTTVISLFAQWLGYSRIRFRILGAVPEDLIGYPKIVETEDGRMVTRNIPHEDIANIAISEKTIVIFDELNRANEALQNVISTIVDRELGQFNLPNSCLIFATMNEFGLGTFELNEAIISRFAFFECGLELKEELTALIQGNYTTEKKFQKIPDNWTEYIPTARTRIASFLQRRPTAITGERLNVQNRPWPCPRTIHKNAVKGIAACFSVKRQDLEEDVLTATVGAAFASEFVAWRQNLNLPDPNEVLQNILNGKTVRYESPYIMLVSISDVLALIAAMANREEKQNAVDKVMEFLAKSYEGSEEVVIPLVKSILSSYPDARVPVRLMRMKEFLS